MQKKKLDLTSDIIVVDEEPLKVTESPQRNETLLPQSRRVQTSSNNQYEEVEGKKVGIHISITPEQRTEFKIWCLQHNVSMNDAFWKAFELLKKLG